MRRLGRPPHLLAQLGRFLAALGRHREACQVIEELEILRGRQYVSSLATTYVHRALGNHEEVFKGLEQAFEQRSGALPFLGVEPGWDPVRGEPRFAAMLRRLGLAGRSNADAERRTPSLAVH